MGEDLLSSLTFEKYHPSTLLSMDTSGSSEESDHDLNMQPQPMVLSGAPDINLPLSAESSPQQLPWSMEHCDMLDVALGPQICDSETILQLHKTGSAARKCSKRCDSIWGAWFFFNYYFKPVLSEKSKGKVTWDASGVCGFEKSDLQLDVFLVQHDMENMYMWVFKDRPDNALGKMQLRSYMNGHSRLGEPQFPFSIDRGFVRSHRMQRKHYRGLSNPQCVHGIEVVASPNLGVVCDADRKKWMTLTGRDINFSLPPEASGFGSWRNVHSIEFELERPSQPKNKVLAHPEKILNGSNFNLSSQLILPSGDAMDTAPGCNKRKKDFFSHGMIDGYCLPANPCAETIQDVELHQTEPSWMHELTGVLKHAYGPVTAAKTIYEDDDGYLIMVSLPFVDPLRLKVTWRNCLTHGIVKILCASSAMMPYIKRHGRIFKLTDSSPEHCPPGEFIREITLPTRIAEDAKLEAFFEEKGSLLEIMIPKQVEPEEHEVRVCMRPPHMGVNVMLT